MDAEKLIIQLKKHQNELDKLDITIDQALHQLEIFSRGMPYADIIKPCRINDGIFVIDKSRCDELIEYHKQAALSGRLMKFVPASGASTRMFTNLQSYLNSSGRITLSKLKKDADNNSSVKSVSEFIENIKRFAFFDELREVLKKCKIDLQNLNDKDDITQIIKKTLNPDGLNYSFYPKGAILFHKYAEETRTAFEEHIYEAVELVKDQPGTVRIHFTISEEHTNLFLKIISKTVNDSIAKEVFIKTTFSYQKQSTNTISVTLENELFLDENGQLVFRPGGHGALIENLNDISGDIVLIKNIDNILPATKNKKSVMYTKIMTGFLISIQKELFSYLRILEQKKINESLVAEIKEFASKYFSVQFNNDFHKLITEMKASYLFDKLNRPIRVCGVVKNEGHPGGGPFWVKNSRNEISLQIVEESQIDKNNPTQLKALKEATHFNPVDIVCAVKDYNGNNFNLKKYVDTETGLITNKTHEGKPLKALELPGLWNGGMADWNTLFVEIPKETFNPVKEINDLLNPAHQVIG